MSSGVTVRHSKVNDVPPAPGRLKLKDTDQQGVFIAESYTLVHIRKCSYI